MGSFMYGMAHMRIDIAHVIRLVSIFMNNIRKEYWYEMK